MSLLIRVPTSAYHTQRVTLNEISYEVTFKYNTSDKYWYIDISLTGGEILILGRKVMPNQNLTGRYPYEKPLEGGDLWCLRRIVDFSDVGRNNFGIGKTYQLVWLSDEEMIEASVNDTIQL